MNRLTHKIISALIISAMLGVGYKVVMPMYNEYQRTGSITVPLINKTIDLGSVGNLDGGTSGTSVGGGKIPQGKDALAVLNTLPVKGRAPKTGYTREQFGSAWTDKATGVQYAGNGCDTRDDILQRDLTNVVLAKNKCTVLSGTLNDPYTGKVIQFKRGPQSARVQIDHLIPLSLAWQTGAQQLSEAQRVALANDPRNLLAVDGPANGSKGDGDAATWLPPNRRCWCSYAAAQVNVRKIYGLWVTLPEKNALTKILNGCTG